MCDTLNQADAQTCNTCGYIFEDFKGARSFELAPRVQNSWVTSTAHSSMVNQSAQHSALTGTPLFVSSTPTRTHMISAVATALFTVPVIFGMSHDVYSFVLGVVLPMAGGLFSFLFSAKKYEFFNDLLRMHSFIGRSSEIQYSDLKIQSPWRGRWRGMILSRIGKRRRIFIPTNPKNRADESLNRFLEMKLYKTAEIN